MAINENIRFNFGANLLYALGDRWDYDNAYPLGGEIIINPNGRAVCLPEETIMNRQFQYFMVAVDYEIEEQTEISRFKNSPYIFITETYKNEENEIYKNISRSIGLIDFNSRRNEKSMEVIFESPASKLGFYKFEIINNTDKTLTIRNAFVYPSADISKDQVGDIVGDINDSSKPSGFKVYTDESRTNLRGISVTLRNSEKELKFKPVYSGELLSSIDTNTGINYPVVYVVGKIDLDDKG